MEKYKVILFYKFIDIENPKALMEEQRAICVELGLKGRVLIAEEGINGTLEGTNENIEIYKNKLRENSLFADMKFKESEGKGNSFTKLYVKVRKEIVTLGTGKLDTKTKTAPFVTADQLEEMYKNNEEFFVLDLRNDYEIATGKFDNTLDPSLGNFRDLPEKMKELEKLKDKKIVTVCTGGVRCEKATCLFTDTGFKNIYQLQDGIHTYMEKYPASHFKGTLFVFDNRMTTPVVDVPNREVIGKCEYCNATCETYYNNDSLRPSRKIICCDSCYSYNKEDLRPIL